MPESAADIGWIVDEVERYLARHPSAADTAEGIARWWITPSRFDVPVLRVALALDYLVEQHVLTRQLLPDGRHVYARAVEATANPLADKRMQ